MVFFTIDNIDSTIFNIFRISFPLDVKWKQFQFGWLGLHKFIKTISRNYLLIYLFVREVDLQFQHWIFFSSFLRLIAKKAIDSKINFLSNMDSFKNAPLKLDLKKCTKFTIIRWFKNLYMRAHIHIFFESVSNTYEWHPVGFYSALRTREAYAITMLITEM